jgi:hypothetical protein
MAQKKPVNFFATKHFLGVLLTFYISSLSPAIDLKINNKLTNKDLMNLLNTLVVSVAAASLKLLDEEVYTSKFLLGRNKQDAINNIKSDITTELVHNINEVSNVTDIINQVSNVADFINEAPIIVKSNRSSNKLKS